MDKVDKLTWKYFWEQKINEIFKVISIIGLILLIPLLVFHLSYFINPEFVNNASEYTGILYCWSYDIAFPNCIYDLASYTFLNKWLFGFFYTVGIFIGLLMLWLIYYLFESWLISNWDKARERARKEVKKK